MSRIFRTDLPEGTPVDATVFATSKDMGDLVATMLIGDGKAVNPEIIDENDDQNSYLPNVRGVMLALEERRLPDRRMYLAMNTTDPMGDTGAFDCCLDRYKWNISYVCFCPGFDYIFDGDTDLMAKYAADRECPTENTKKSKIKFIRY